MAGPGAEFKVLGSTGNVPDSADAELMFGFELARNVCVPWVFLAVDFCILFPLIQAQPLFLI